MQTENINSGGEKIIILLFGLVIDTFIITSVNNKNLVSNLKNYLGIETIFSIMGFLIGSVLLLFIKESYFKLLAGIIIIFLQVIQFKGIEFGDKVNALLLGSDSLVVFATLPWYYIPILFVCELCAITLGSLIGSNVMKLIPIKYHDIIPNIVMILIGLIMIIEVII